MIRVPTVISYIAALCLWGAASFAGDVTVFAAASMKNAMDEIAQGFEAESGHTVVVSLAGSSALARQIELGAPAEVFISANAAWMDVLEEAGRIEGESRFDLAGNALVLIGHGAGEAVTIDPDLDLAAMLGDGRLAMALVDAVPAGIYGKAALAHLGLWDSVAAQVAQADNVRAALQMVAMGAVQLGVVYASDAVADPRVTVLGRFPAESHAPITYPAALVTGAGEEARALMAYLAGDAARAALVRQGFTVPERGR